jgi:hypothetical protein
MHYVCLAVLRVILRVRELWLAFTPGFKESFQFVFYQLERFFRAQHQRFHLVPA